MNRKYLKPVADIIIPLICWIYYIPGYLLFFAPVYLAAFVLSRNREIAWQKLNHLFFKIFFRILRSITPGLSFHVADEVFSIRSAVIVSNHVSYLDPIFLISLFEKQKTIVKRTFFKLPVFGWILKTSGYIPSTLDGNPDMIRRIEDMGAYLASGGNLFIFPEGTRSRDGRIGRFNKSAFKIAANCNAPIYVLFIQNTDVLFPPGRFRFNTCVPNTIRIELIGRIAADNKNSSVSELAEEARTMMLHRRDQLNKPSNRRMNMDLSRSMDVLVIGSGIGGLSTGILLAKSGFTVTVLEKNRLPGGMTRGYTRQGVECPVGIHYLGALGSGQILRRFFDFLGVSSEIAVERMGGAGIIDRYIFDDLTFDLPEGMDAYEKNLRAAFPDEQHQITGIMQLLRQAEKHLNSLDFLFSDQIGFAQPEQFQAIGEIMTRLGCSPGLKGVLGVPSCWIGVPPDQCPAFYHNMALATYLMSSWRVKNSVQMVDAFVRRLENLGGRVVCGDGVESILVESRRVRGVRTVSGIEIKAPVVVGAVHPKVVLAMLPDEAVRPLYRKRISGLKDTYGIMCVHAQLDVSAHPEIPHNIFRIDRDETGNIPDLRYYHIRAQGGKSTMCILTSGKAELWRKWEGTRTGQRGRDYVEAKEEQARNLLLEAGKIFGPLKGCQMLDVYTPLTIRDWVNSPAGSAYGVVRSCDQLVSASLLNRSSVEGLFLAGQSVMAPGVIGTIMGSFHTARFILGPERFQERIALSFKGDYLGE